MIVWRLTIMDAIDDRFGKIVVTAIHRTALYFLSATGTAAPLIVPRP